jgi:putative ABC transport system permease protein
MYLVLHTESAPLSLLGAARAEVRALDRTVPVSEVKTLEQQLDGSVAIRRLSMTLLLVFALLALVLAAVGIYGVMSYSVSQRTHEIGIRMALGAQPADVLKLVVRQGMVLTLIGVAVGLAASFALTRFLSSLLFGVSATDPVTFAGVALLLAAVALAASYLPARRATKVDPMVALRYE